MTEEKEKVRELPKGWSNVKLGEIIEFEYGKSLTKSLRNETGVFPVLGSSGIVGYHNEYLVEAPVLIIGRKGAVGEVWFSDKNCWPIDTTYFVIAPQFLSTKFIFFLLKSLRLHQYDKSTTIPGLNRNDAYRLSVELPPFAEQQRIVEKIEELFSELAQGIESLKKAQKQLKVYRQVVLKWAFEGKLTEKWRSQIQQEKLDIKTGEELLAQIKAEREKRYQQKLAEWEKAIKIWEKNGKPGKKITKPQKSKDLSLITKLEFAELPQLPDDWCLERLGNLAEIIGGVTKGRNLEGQETISLPYLRVANVQDGYFDLSVIKHIKVLPSELNKYRLIAGDVLYTEGGDKDKLGRGSVWKQEIKDCIHQNHVFRARLLADLVIPFFIAYYSQTRTAKDYFFKRAKQTVNLASINMTILSNFPIPIPSYLEQEQIVQEIESRLSICDQLEFTLAENIQKAEALRQSILKQAFEGKLVPQDPNDEPAEKLLERIKQEKLKVKKDEQLSIQGV